MVSTDKGKVCLAWRPAVSTVTAPVDEYMIEMAPEFSDDFVEMGHVDSKTCSFEAGGLENGRKYNFRIKAQNQCGCSDGVQLDKTIVASPMGKGFLAYALE